MDPSGIWKKEIAKSKDTSFHILKGEMMSKRFAVCVVFGFFVLLIVCSIWGEAIYRRVTPEVPVKRVQEVTRGEKKYIQVSRSALTDDSKLYYVVSEQGFSRTIYRVYCIEPDYMLSDFDDSQILVKTRLPRGCMVVSKPEKAIGLPDGSKVLPK